VHLLTPLEREGSDTLVMVNRGWVYSADAAEVDRTKWREADSVTLSGYALPLVPDGIAPPSDRERPLRTLSVTALQARTGRLVAPVVIVMTSDSAPRAEVPRRIETPVLAPGNHKSYAIQWFAFALIAVAGGVLLFRRSVAAR
jgi:surfeit locus 1 family protein